MTKDVDILVVGAGPVGLFTVLKQDYWDLNVT